MDILKRPLFQKTPFSDTSWPLNIISVAPPAEPRGEKTTFFFVQILGGENLLKFGEKWAVKNV